MYRMIRIFLLIPFLMFSQGAFSQFGNEWINYDSEYFKFKIGKDGIYRIDAATLFSYGLSAVPGSQFTIYRNGTKIPLYVSTASTFGSGDFIEFYATKNDGRLETALYPDPAWHPTQEYSMITDTAHYFLTYRAESHPRYSSAAFTIPSPPPVQESFYWYTQISNDGNCPPVFFRGRSYDDSYATSKATFDAGEGYALNLANNNNPKTSTNPFSVPGLYSSPSLNAKFSFTFTNGQRFTGNPSFYIGSNLIHTAPLDGFGYVRQEFSVETSKFTATTNIISRDPGTRGGFNIIKLEYPRSTDLSMASSSFIKFKNNENAAGLYYVLTNVPNAGTQPVLYNLNNSQRMVGVVSSGTTVSFYLSGSTERQEFVFIGENDIQSVTSLYPVEFVDYNQSSHQGDYIILTHRGYIEDPTDPIGKYKMYRESTAGGSRKVAVVDVLDLYDQFYYGADYNPEAIKNFLKYAQENWTEKPQTVFIIGKGVLYTNYRTYLSNASSYSFGNLVPTFGHPGSDVLLVDLNNDDNPDIEVGRLSAWNAEEINNYLDKVKRYEAAINSTEIPNLDNSLWKKSALHIAGGDKDLQTRVLVPTLTQCEKVLADSFYAGFATTIKKSTTDILPEITDNELIEQTLNNGVHRLTFYGHAYSTGFDYNLNEPDLFNVSPKFPMFYAMGCDIAQIFGFTKTIGENYLNSVNGGSVAIIASNNYGYTGYLGNYIVGMYRQFSYLNFGKTLGTQYKDNIQRLPGSATDNKLKVHKQCLILQGDPGLANYNPEYPDYYTDNEQITPSKNPLTTADTAVDIKVKFYNLGKYTDSTVSVVLEHRKPDGSVIHHDDTFYIKVASLDSVTFNLKINPIVDVGQNVITVKINPDNRQEEISTLNNTAVVSIFVSEDVLRPVYPYEFSIVHTTPLELRASALNVFETEQDYILQIDTTEAFNSPLKQEKMVKGSIGGVVKWQPGIMLKDSTVYYWRTAVASAVTDSTNWQYSSFIYLAGGSDGWNQSHYFQFNKNKPYTNLELEESDRIFRFNEQEVLLEVRNRVIDPANEMMSDTRVLLDNDQVDRGGCAFTGSLRFMLIDTLTLKPVPYNSIHRSVPPCLTVRNNNQYEFHVQSAVNRERVVNFIDQIPAGYYLIVYNFLFNSPSVWSPNSLASAWDGDDAIYGETNTLKYKLKQLGFDQIDSFNRKRVFIFLTKTGDPDFENITMFSEGIEDLLVLQLPVKGRNPYGDMKSVTVGPGKNWASLLWNVNHTDERPENDSFYFNVKGKNELTGAWDDLYTGTENSLNLEPIVPPSYQYIKLNWFSKDTMDRTSANLKFWRVLYDPLPEAALNPIAKFEATADSLMQGRTFEFLTAIENISHLDMDSMLVKYSITKADGTNELLDTIRYKKLPAGDTLLARFSFDPRNYGGANTLIVEANPSNDQPEHFHPNNLGYFPLFVIEDDVNPVLDVTFDGVHILDKDIVSAKPMIKIQMRDENSYSLLQDSALLKVQLLRPGKSTPEDVIIDGVTAVLHPATSLSKNEMIVEYNPELLEDGEYKLIVSGKDVADNAAGSSSDKYEISFLVENKPTVSSLLNYPNPFSTSTAFLFTLTGSEIPDQFKIQIMTVTGKIVKEITKEELGPIRIGRNISEYKWDGRDQYGQLLGNGVYIYRLIVNHQGNKLEHRKNHQVDKYFNKNGYGKLYIMR